MCEMRNLASYETEAKNGELQDNDFLAFVAPL